MTTTEVIYIYIYIYKIHALVKEPDKNNIRFKALIKRGGEKKVWIVPQELQNKGVG